MKLLKAVSVFIQMTLPLIALNAYASESCRMLDSDPDGDGWGWEAGASCRITADTGNTPQMNHPRTGQTINLERIFWVWEDFSNKTINECQGYIVDPAQSRDICSTCRVAAASIFHGADGRGLYSSASDGVDASNDDTETDVGQTVIAANSDDNEIGCSVNGEMDLNDPDDSDPNDRVNIIGRDTECDAASELEDGSDRDTTAENSLNNGIVETDNSDGVRQAGIEATFEWNVDNQGVYSGALAIGFYGERTEAGVRFWEESAAGQIGFYTLCEVTPSTMGQFTENPADAGMSDGDAPACIDIDGDGWGWDGSATCIP